MNTAFFIDFESLYLVFNEKNFINVSILLNIYINKVIYLTDILLFINKIQQLVN